MKLRIAVIGGMLTAFTIVPIASAHASDLHMCSVNNSIVKVACGTQEPHYVSNTVPMFWTDSTYLKLGYCPRWEQPGHAIDNIYSWIRRGLPAFRHMELPASH